MNYISPGFTLFVIALMLLFYAVPQRLSRLQNLVLLTGSLFFYLCFDLRYILFLLFAALSTFFSALLLPKTRFKKSVLAGCAAANLAVWFAVKVLPWSIELGNFLLYRLRMDRWIEMPALLVPVGISYFTLQAVGYLVDVYRDKQEPERDASRYLLFLSYFPAIVQGPISRYSQLGPQLSGHKSFSFDSFRRGLLLIALGLVKKLVLADRLAYVVNSGFDTYTAHNGAVLYLVAVAYSIQLYMDFSGCVDICRGVSRLFRIELIHNFNRPYLATSIRDFWAKWHISLSGWLKDYVYIPLGGNRKGTVKKYRNLLLTFLVSGLWHGAGLDFLFWGALHAVYQIIGSCSAALRGKFREQIGLRPGSSSERILQTVVTFNFVTLAWIFFRAPSLALGMDYVGRMLTNPSLNFSGIYSLGLAAGYFPLLVLHLLIFFAVELRTESQEQALDGILQQHVLIRWPIYLLLVLDVLLFGAYGSAYDMSGFLYGGF